jgi:hypothetical protein
MARLLRDHSKKVVGKRATYSLLEFDLERANK